VNELDGMITQSKVFRNRPRLSVGMDKYHPWHGS